MPFYCLCFCVKYLKVVYFYNEANYLYRIWTGDKCFYTYWREFTYLLFFSWQYKTFPVRLSIFPDEKYRFSYFEIVKVSYKSLLLNQYKIIYFTISYKNFSTNKYSKRFVGFIHYEKNTCALLTSWHTYGVKPLK